MEEEWKAAFYEVKGAGSFHIHRKTMKELCTLAVLGVREQPNLAQNSLPIDIDKKMPPVQ